jgi:hypothetical protein
MESSPPVSVVYRVYFQTVEPLLALTGAYVSHFTPANFVNVMSPAAFAFDVVSPVIQLLLSTLASTYLLFSLNEALVLRLSADVNVWRAVTAACLICDAGHLYAIYVSRPDLFWALSRWRSADWTNMGILWFDVALRVSFLLGIGVREKSKSENKNMLKKG